MNCVNLEGSNMKKTLSFTLAILLVVSFATGAAMGEGYDVRLASQRNLSSA